MEPIICKNNPKVLVNKIQEYLAQGRILKDLYLLEENENQIVLLLNDQKINENDVQIWWAGYSAGLKSALT